MDEFLVHFCCRHPRGWCGLKYCIYWEMNCQQSRHPRGWCGLKCKQGFDVICAYMSPPARVVWIEISVMAGRKLLVNLVATREGGVD